MVQLDLPGVAPGAITGLLLSSFFETAYVRKHCIRNSMKVIWDFPVEKLCSP